MSEATIRIVDTPEGGLSIVTSASTENGAAKLIAQDLMKMLHKIANAATNEKAAPPITDGAA